MRGQDDRSGALFSYVDLESRVPGGHPLRRIRTIVNQALVALSVDFDQLYGRIGRPGVPPEMAGRAGSPIVGVAGKRPAMKSPTGVALSACAMGKPLELSDVADWHMTGEVERFEGDHLRRRKLGISGSVQGRWNRHAFLRLDLHGWISESLVALRAQSGALAGPAQ